MLSHAENEVKSGMGGEEDPSGLRPPPLREGRSWWRSFGRLRMTFGVPGSSV